MKKRPQTLKSQTEIKVFLLFLLDRIGYPIDYPSLSSLIAENAPTLSLDYEECIGALTDMGHVYTDTADGVRYYMISDQGRKIASELYDTLDPMLREKSERCAARYLSLSSRDAKLNSHVEKTESGRYVVEMGIRDTNGEMLTVRLSVPSKAEAEIVRGNFELKPESLYRSVLYGLTGKVEYIV